MHRQRRGVILPLNRARAFDRKLYDLTHRARLKAELLIRRALDLKEPEAKLVKASQVYWNDAGQQMFGQNSHWRGAGIFADDERWLALGREHLKLYRQFARALDCTDPPRRILEWGCGGGLNAVLFGQGAEAYYGVDVSPASLDECGRQMIAAGAHNFVPVLIDAEHPEAALDRVREGHCDLFLSTYVFEVLPTPEYGLRVLKIAHRALAPGGLALVQVKYEGDTWRTSSRQWNYAANLAWNAAYRIDKFWLAAAECGFEPKMVTLVPRQPLIDDHNYAYFLLVKPRTASEAQ